MADEEKHLESERLFPHACKSVRMSTCTCTHPGRKCIYKTIQHFMINILSVYLKAPFALVCVFDSIYLTAGTACCHNVCDKVVCVCIYLIFHDLFSSIIPRDRERATVFRFPLNVNIVYYCRDILMLDADNQRLFGYAYKAFLMVFMLCFILTAEHM